MITQGLRYPPTWPTDPAQEKGIDVALAIDFVRLAITGAYDVGVMMSTDTDLLPALRFVYDHDLGLFTLQWQPGVSLRIAGTTAARSQRLVPLAGPDGLQRRGGSEQVLTPVGGVHSVITRNGYCTNRKGHCGREGRGDTLLNLTPKEASRICMDQCRAMCCRGPLILRLEPDEVAVFHREAVHLGTTADISPAADGGGNLLFLDHPGECCPMLDQATFACRIYEQRPRVCREFPRRPEPGCAISGWTDG